MKVTITLDDELMHKIDSYADENYTSRSGYIAAAVNQYIIQHEVVMALKGLSVAMNKIADTGKIDEETKTELEDFERIANLMYGTTVKK